MGMSVGSIWTVSGLIVLHALIQIWLNKPDAAVAPQHDLGSGEFGNSERDRAFEAECQARHIAFEEERQARRERGRHHNPGARVIQTTHDAVTLEMPDWGPVQMNVEPKNDWEDTDLPPQTQWERLLAED